jgi:hypothetical protein
VISSSGRTRAPPRTGRESRRATACERASSRTNSRNRRHLQRIEPVRRLVEQHDGGSWMSAAATPTRWRKPFEQCWMRFASTLASWHASTTQRRALGEARSVEPVHASDEARGSGRRASCRRARCARAGSRASGARRAARCARRGPRPDRARVGREPGREQAQERALPGTVRAEEPDHLAALRPGTRRRRRPASRRSAW